MINDNLELCYKRILDLMNFEKKGVVQKQDLKEIELKIKELTK